MVNVKVYKLLYHDNDRVVIVSRLASENTLKQIRDVSQWRIYARKIPHVYALSL